MTCTSKLRLRLIFVHSPIFLARPCFVGTLMIWIPLLTWEHEVRAHPLLGGFWGRDVVLLAGKEAPMDIEITIPGWSFQHLLPSAGCVDMIRG